VVYSVREPLLTDEESKFIHHLYRVATSGEGEPLRLTYGEASNEMPRWSPDGRYIAFLSDRKGVKNLYIMRAEGGEAWPLTNVEKDIQSFAWSPDGRQLAFVMVPPDSPEKRAARKAKNDPILWGVEFERAAAWVIPFAGEGAEHAEPRRLTGGAQHVVCIEWSADGDKLAFIYQETPEANDWLGSTLAVVDVEQGEASVRDLAVVAVWQPVCKAYGRFVACPTGEKPVRWIWNRRVVLYPLDGGEPVPLALTEEAGPVVVGWLADGQQVYISEARGTTSVLEALPVDGGEPLVLLAGEGLFSLFRTNGQGDLAFVWEDTDRPNTLCVWRAGEGRWRPLVSPIASDWPSRDKLPRSEVIRWTSRDGLEIEGIVTYPLDYTPGKRYPTLLIIHGGPMGVFSRRYVADLAAYPVASFAERGYVILRPNPRGSSGYGADFRLANEQDWGGGDYEDLMRGVDELISRGIADPERLGVMGWSYGGYMTARVITQTQRFKAASVGAGLSNLVSMTGTTDIPSFMVDYFGGELWENIALYEDRSAIYHIQNVSTPTLIQHGEKDRRVPLSQSQELYTALKRRGVEVQLVIYPRQEHAIREPRLLMDVARRNLEWFDRWLQG
ncbi:MAG: S9 family peptidase, partial [Anaerolineae bacterium]|nr:S9 family peptidase [Anaerolineae bacterium]